MSGTKLSLRKLSQADRTALSNAWHGSWNRMQDVADQLAGGLRPLTEAQIEALRARRVEDAAEPWGLRALGNYVDLVRRNEVRHTVFTMPPMESLARQLGGFWGAMVSRYYPGWEWKKAKTEAGTWVLLIVTEKREFFVAPQRFVYRTLTDLGVDNTLSGPMDLESLGLPAQPGALVCLG